MIFLTLEKKKLPQLLDAILREFRLLVPERKGEKTYIFSEYSGFDRVALEFLRTILPPKRFFLPPIEELFSIDRDFNMSPGASDNDFSILFGLHPCDLHGIDILDRAFSYKGGDDFYRRRRAKVGLIGLSCLPDKYCFCKSMHTDFIESVYDLFLYTLDNVYMVSVRTALGDDMVRIRPELFKECTERDIFEYKERIKARDSKFVKIIDITNLADFLTLEYKSDIWGEYGKKCLFCGSCVMVCPTCQCFDIYDSDDLINGNSTRWKRWDACMRKDFALITGGHNFRLCGAERFRFRYLHKEIGFGDEHGKPSCTGCGRCSEACPAGIVMDEVVRRIRE